MLARISARLDGFLNLNKPSGWTSHDCVAKVRRWVGLKKVGHGGTLDPAATGVLPIAMGRATRLLQFLPSDKAYRATVRFGVRTTTDDLDGDLIETQPSHHLTLDAIAPYLPQFEGTIQQIPPRYSAIQVGGQRLYDLARMGKEVDVPVRTVEVHHIQVLDWRPGDAAEGGSPKDAELDLAIACGGGTYIRAIARDLGQCLGTGATLAALTRTESGGFQLSNSVTLEQLEQQLQAGAFCPIPVAIALQHLPAVHLQSDAGDRWQNGQKLVMFRSGDSSSIQSTPHLPQLDGPYPDTGPDIDSDIWIDGNWVRVLAADDRFLGMGQVQWFDGQWILCPKVVWR